MVGHDDIGIVNNITSIISKEPDIQLRSIGISSNDGQRRVRDDLAGLTVMVDDTSKLESLIRKLRTVKGVKQIKRN